MKLICKTVMAKNRLQYFQDLRTSIVVARFLIPVPRGQADLSGIHRGSVLRPGLETAPTGAWEKYRITELFSEIS